jgi:predicted porin
MKSTKIAFAVLAAVAATGAAAQSSVTIYGRVNTTLESRKVTGQDRTTGMFNNASRWGIRGSEDLGGGTSALFQLESGFNSDDGRLTNNGGQGANPGIFNREAFAGLTGGWGTLRAGRITSPVYFATADYISMHNHDTGISSDFLFGFGATGGNNNNSVTYKTPSFGGADVEVAYSFNANGNENPGSANERNAQVAFNYVGGPLHLGAGIAQMDNKQVTPTSKNQTAVIRALYEIGAITVGAYYERSKLDVGGTRRSRNNLRLSGMFTAGASEFHANYGLADDFSGLSNSGADQFTLGYNYNLSKRTKVYAFYTQVDDDSNSSFYVGGNPGDKLSSVAAGVRHNF